VATYPDKKVRVIFCDVGQGDAILISKGGTQVLVDGGPYGGGAKGSLVLDCLDENMAFWDRRIEAVIVTHPDLDHAGGLISVMERYKVDKFFSNGGDGDSLGWREVQKMVKEDEIFEKILSRGELIGFEGVEFEVLAPEKGDGDWEDANEGSLVMMLRAGGKNILLMGDAPVSVEQRLVWRKVLDEKVDILKAGHHGSKTSTSVELLDRVDPKLVVFSVGKGNSYGHPAKEVVERGEKRGVEIRRTDEEGEIKFVFD